MSWLVCLINLDGVTVLLLMGLLYYYKRADRAPISNVSAIICEKLKRLKLLLIDNKNIVVSLFGHCVGDQVTFFLIK